MKHQCLALAAAVGVALGSMGPAVAGDLVRDGRIVSVANTGNNQPAFIVQVSGGTVNLCGTSYIIFPASAAPDADTHKRAYAAALLALTTGAHVRIYNYQGDTCDTASFIQLAAP